MKFSIVIPTRNRLEYLQTAIFSVLRQDYDDWEIIVSDNDSIQDIQSYVLSLNDSRIHYSRTEKFISVTENWNRALNQSRGEYIIVIGDDDCLMQGALSLLVQLISDNRFPEIVFSNALLYIYPGFSSEFPKGHLTTIGNWHLWNCTSPSLVKLDEARNIVKESMNFRLRFSYNMQTLTIHHSLIEKLKLNGNFFHSPYPDFYAMTVLLQKAEKILACPYPLIIVGICPKSFGGFSINDQEELGMETLHTEAEINQYPELTDVILPGKKFNICWLYALRSAQKTINDSTFEINFQRFRKLQIVEFLSMFQKQPIKISALIRFYFKLNLKEKIIYFPYLFVIQMGKILGEKKCQKIIQRMQSKLNIHPGHINYQFKNKFNSILEIMSAILPLECHKHFK
jgi:glycosyltransferase involved in cell wall biosynthesis